ncbi:ABC transporter permease [candidate division WOR-3 bacterium]|nr:ABC transporter permease [candidate division WOR-3 bacterium]
MNVDLFIAKRYLRSRHRKFFSLSTMIAIGGIFVGVAALLITLSLMNGFQNELRRRILGGTPHIILRRYFNEPMQDHEEIMKKLEQFSFIEEKAPFIFQKSIVRLKNRIDGVAIKGVDAAREVRITEIANKMVDGVFDLENGCVMGTELAFNLKASVGDTIIIASPFSVQIGLLPQARKVVLRGIFDFGYYEYNATFIYMDIKDVQTLFNMGQNVSGIQISVDNVYATRSYTKQIDRVIGYPYRSVDWVETNRSVFAALRLEKVVTFIVLALIILVAAFNIVGTLVNMVKKKTKEIGILRSYGFTRGSIMKIFMYHGFMLGLIGTFAGLAFAFLACMLLSKYQFINLPGDVYFIETLPVEMAINDFIVTTAAAIIICFLATIYPAVRATRLTTVEALRNE